MENNMTTKFLMIFIFTSTNALAGIQVDASRVIYPGINNSSSLSITNDSEDAYMVQSWLDSGDKNKTTEKNPILITPPILKLAAKKEAILRFIYSGVGLPEDRESLFWVNIQEIPSAPKQENVLQIAIRTRIKLFYRPTGIITDLKSQAAALKWSRQGGNLIVKNDGPLHITFAKLELKNMTGKQWDINADMVNPHEGLIISLPSAARSADNLSFTYINDYGGLSKIDNIQLKKNS